MNELSIDLNILPVYGSWPYLSEYWKSRSYVKVRVKMRVAVKVSNAEQTVEFMVTQSVNQLINHGFLEWSK